MNSSKRMRMSKEALKNSIDGEAALKDVELCITELRSAVKDEVPAIVARGNLQLAKLKKICPDEKAVTHTITPADPMAAFLQHMQGTTLEGELVTPKAIENGSSPKH